MVAPIESNQQSGGRGAVPHGFMTANERGWTYTGSREQLLGAGVCTPAHFPEGKKRTAWNYNGDVGRCWRIDKVKGGLWTLWIERTREETDEFKKLAQARESHSLRVELTEEQWKARRLSGTEYVLSAFTGEGSTAFRLAARDRELIASLARRMEMVLRTATLERIDVPAEVESSDLPPTLLAPLKLAWSSSAPCSVSPRLVDGR